MLTLDKIYHAAFVLKDVARKTDLIEAPKLSKDWPVWRFWKSFPAMMFARA